MKKKTYSLTEYACKKCGGRILQMEGNYITGGGNPIYLCASCQQSTCDLCPDNIGEYAPQKFKELAATDSQQPLNAIALWEAAVEHNPILLTMYKASPYFTDFIDAVLAQQQ